ncbi:unknown [Collinsella sp. CAG:398]|nr:unknown [Collinsella sp. CAG:398]
MEGLAGDIDRRGEHAEVDGKAAREPHDGLDTAPVDRKKAEEHADEGEADHLGVRGEAKGAPVGNGGEVVDKAEDSGSQRGDEHKCQLCGEPAHDEAGDRQGDEDDDATHRGGTLLDEVLLGAVGAHLLSEVLDPHDANPQRHDHRGDNRCDSERDECLIGWIGSVSEH